MVEVLKYEDLSQVILVGNSSGGMVITGVAERAPERLAQLVYLDAFVQEDGESLFDNLPPERQEAMETLVASEGDGWLLPRFAPPPWERILPEIWGVTDEADQRSALTRLVATPFAHFKQPVRRGHPLAAMLPRRLFAATSGRTRPSIATPRRRAGARAGSLTSWQPRTCPSSRNRTS